MTTSSTIDFSNGWPSYYALCILSYRLSTTYIYENSRITSLNKSSNSQVNCYKLERVKKEWQKLENLLFNLHILPTVHAYSAKICCYTINFRFSTLLIIVILSNMGSIRKNTSWHGRIFATHSLLSLIITGGRVSPWWAVTGHFTRFLMAFSLGPIGKMSSNKCLWASYPQARGTDLSGEFFFLRTFLRTLHSV